MNALTKEQWIEEAYQLLCKSQGAPANETEARNLREWAESFANCDNNYYEEGLTPQEAHDEEMSCG